MWYNDTKYHTVQVLVYRVVHVISTLTIVVSYGTKISWFGVERSCLYIYTIFWRSGDFRMMWGSDSANPSRWKITRFWQNTAITRSYFEYTIYSVISLEDPTLFVHLLKRRTACRRPPQQTCYLLLVLALLCSDPSDLQLRHATAVGQHQQRAAGETRGEQRQQRSAEFCSARSQVQVRASLGTDTVREHPAKLATETVS